MKVLAILPVLAVIVYGSIYWLNVFDWGLGAVIVVISLACFLLLGEIEQ